MRGGKILIVDDDADTRALVTRALAREDYEIKAAPGPAPGCQQIKTFQPDLVIVDLLFPGGDGHVLLEYLRAFPQIKVIVLSATVAEPRHEHDGSRSLVYLQKPIQVADVRAAVMQALMSERS